ncbi:GntR family transcriptional regulator [Clostridium chrysemydis]|uniref:GntR family transcriptional regulator n=1 Tax=Clostridium chrysemydis TaxID=2665504 RepID=UPI0018841B10|nr:GntR family transcriptional regulator [Clostridium chrysemydis]
MILELDTTSEIPIYQQIRNSIVIGIARGKLKEGDSLPSVRSLASSIGINLHTVNKAYNLLKDEGYLVVDRRNGAMVHLDFKGKEEKFMDSLKENIEISIAECIVRKVEEEEIIRIIKEKFKGI